MLRNQGNLSAALESFRASLDIAERLVKADPGNTEWQQDVGLSLQRIGLVAADQGDTAVARTAYERGLAIMQALVARAPDHAAFKRDLAWFEARLKELGEQARN